jgi:mannose-6-phosphate isomerase-like protein (cupin superfamily)
MSNEITTPLTAPPGAPSQRRGGPVDGVLIARDLEGKTLVELSLDGPLADGSVAPFSASWWTVEPGETTPVDRHEVHELWLVARGEGAMRLGSEELQVRAGQAIYIPPDDEHVVTATGSEDLVVFSTWWSPHTTSSS